MFHDESYFMHRIKNTLIGLFLIWFPITLFADIEVENPTPFPPMKHYNIGGVDVSGYISASYNYLSQSALFVSDIPSRFYDQKENGFTLQQFSLTFAKQPKEGLGGLLNIIVGNDSLINSPFGFDPLFENHPSIAIDPFQAFLQYQTKKWNFMLGKLASLVGYESTFPTLNRNFSSSYEATYLEPTTVTGLRAEYEINNKIKLAVGVNNGWDTIKNWNRRKTIEFGGVYIDKIYLFSVYIYNGEEQASPQLAEGPNGIRNLIDVVGSIQINDNLKLAANYDYATQNRALLPTDLLGRAVGQAFAGYVEYKINSCWRTALRTEYFIDKNGYATGLKQNLKELTFTVGYLVMKNFELRGETRRDISSTNAFMTKNRLFSRNNLQSFALEGVFTF